MNNFGIIIIIEEITFNITKLHDLNHIFVFHFKKTLSLQHVFYEAVS